MATPIFVSCVAFFILSYAFVYGCVFVHGDDRSYFDML